MSIGTMYSDKNSREFCIVYSQKQLYLSPHRKNTKVFEAIWSKSPFVTVKCILFYTLVTVKYTLYGTFQKSYLQGHKHWKYRLFYHSCF